jgi:hypothetical protein
MIIGMAITIGAVLLVFYPLFTYYWHAVFPDQKKLREEEWKFLAARLATHEYQMIVAINTIRELLGQHPIEAKAVIQNFDDWRWKQVVDEARHSVQSGLKGQKGKEEML